MSGGFALGTGIGFGLVVTEAGREGRTGTALFTVGELMVGAFELVMGATDASTSALGATLGATLGIGTATAVEAGVAGNAALVTAGAGSGRGGSLEGLTNFHTTTAAIARPAAIAP